MHCVWSICFCYGPIWWVCVWHEHCTYFSCSSVGGLFTLRWLSLVAVVSARFAILILPVGLSLYFRPIALYSVVVLPISDDSDFGILVRTCLGKLDRMLLDVSISYYFSCNGIFRETSCEGWPVVVFAVLQCIRFLHSLWTNWFMFIFLMPINIRNIRKVYNFDNSDLWILRSKVQFLRRSWRVRNTAAAPRLHLGCLQQRSWRRSISSWYRFWYFFL